MCSLSSAFAAALCLSLFSAPCRADVVVSDGDFSNWTFGAYTSGTGGPSASMTRETSGGNPGARLNVTTNTPGTSVAFGTGIKTDFSASAYLSGDAYTLTLDVLAGLGSYGLGQFVDLTVEQNGVVYMSNYGLSAVTHIPVTWTTETFSGILTPGSFFNVSGTGPSEPDFSSGVATMFGFAAGNNQSSQLTMYYDNFNLDVTTPEPASFFLFGAGLLTLLWLRPLVGRRSN